MEDKELKDRNKEACLQLCPVTGHSGHRLKHMTLQVNIKTLYFYSEYGQILTWYIDLSLLREVLESPSFEIIKIQLDVDLGNLLWLTLLGPGREPCPLFLCLVTFMAGCHPRILPRQCPLSERRRDTPGNQRQEDIVLNCTKEDIRKNFFSERVIINQKGVSRAMGESPSREMF